MKMTEEQRNLLEDYTPYIKERISYYHFVPPLDVKETTAHVLYELSKVIYKFDENKGTIKGFLNITIRYLIFNYCKKQHPKIKKQPDSDCSSIWTVTPTEPPDIDNRTPETYYELSCKEIAIAHSINELNSKQRNIILLYCYDNLTEQRIANMIGLSKQAISQQLHKALAIIKPKIERRLKELDDIKGDLLWT